MKATFTYFQREVHCFYLVFTGAVGITFSLDVISYLYPAFVVTVAMTNEG